MKYIQIRNHHPKKRAAKCSFCGEEVGNLLNIGRKSKNAGLSPGLNLLLNFLFNSDLFPFNISVEKIKQSNNKKSKRDICLQIQVLKFKCRQSVGHWKFRLNFILEFGAEFSVEYLIPCVFFMCVCLVVFFVFVFFVEYPYVFCPFVFSLLFYYTLISDI